MSKAKEEKAATETQLMVQAGLDIPGDTNVPGVPLELEDLLEPLCQAIHNAGIYKMQENEYKAQVLALMISHKLSTVALPNGGSLLSKPGKPTAQYVAPPKKKSSDAENNEPADPDEGEPSGDEE